MTKLIISPATQITLLKKEKFIDAYKKTNGNITDSASIANIERKTYYNWLESDQEFAMKIFDSEAYLNDEIRQVLIQKAAEGDMTAVIFYLKNRHPDFKQRPQTLVQVNNMLEPEDFLLMTETDYLKFMQKFDIVSKEGKTVPFVSNDYQSAFYKSMSGKDVILKARQIGFSSFILAMFTIDFLTVENSRSVCVSHDAPSAIKLLDRVKFFIKSAQEKGMKIDLKYNSRNELVNAKRNSSFYIGAAGSKSFGRGDTLTNLHLSEFAFYPDPKSMLASALQAVVPDGRVIIESTANGMNFFKEFWDRSKAHGSNFKTHYFDNSFYSKEFLEQKKKELDDLYPQEYPETDIEAFLSSGNPFFDVEAMKLYLSAVKEPTQTFNTYYDLFI